MAKAINTSLFYVNMLVFAALLFLAGSSFAAPQRMYSGPEQPASETALIRGVTSEVNIESCDGLKVTKLEISVLPGEHTVEVSFRGSMSSSSDTTLNKFVVEAGHTYTMDWKQGSSPNSYAVVITDVTTKKLVNFTKVYSRVAAEQRLASMEKRVKEFPRNGGYWGEKGAMLLILERYEEALAALETCISIIPNSPLGWRKKSEALFELKRYDEALTAIDKAISLQPADSEYKLFKETIMKAYTGKGVLTQANGKYEGEVVNGKPHGKGTEVLANGDRYEGTFVDGKRTGKGIYVKANGDRYEGDFVNGAPTGRGIGTRSNGDRFEGAFVNGVPHGKGVITWANGEKYEGDLVKGKPSGEGAVTRANGTKCTGVFQDGKPVGGSSCTVGDTGF